MLVVTSVRVNRITTTGKFNFLRPKARLACCHLYEMKQEGESCIDNLLLFNLRCKKVVDVN